MKLDQGYIRFLLQPFEESVSLKHLEYIAELDKLGISIEDGDSGRIDDKFHRHFEHALEQGLITNSNGIPSLKYCGIRLGANKDIVLMNETFIKKGSVAAVDTSQNITNFNIGGNFSGNLQSGSGNTINTTTIQQLMESLEQSNEPEAKNTLAKLVDIMNSPIVQTVLSNV